MEEVKTRGWKWKDAVICLENFRFPSAVSYVFFLEPPLDYLCRRVKFSLLTYKL